MSQYMYFYEYRAEGAYFTSPGYQRSSQNPLKTNALRSLKLLNLAIYTPLVNGYFVAKP